MSSKVGSLEEKVKLPPTETISRCYQQQGNRKVIRILTVAVYVLCVSLAAIMLSLYYIFIWDPTIRPFVTKTNNCEKIVIPEKIAIRLLNSSEITAEQFYKRILDQYRILNQLQLQRQQFLQKQHLQLQQLAAGNKFQEIFATATIIQAHPNDPIRKPITPTNGTFLLEQRPIVVGDMLETPADRIPEVPIDLETNMDTLNPIPQLPILDTLGPTHMKQRKTHRKHYNHHRHNSRKVHKKMVLNGGNGGNGVNGGAVGAATATGTTTSTSLLALSKEEPINDSQILNETPLNPPISVVHESYTSMPIPLILNSKEDKRPYYADKKSLGISRKRTILNGGTMPLDTVSSTTVLGTKSYDIRNYMHPYLNGELIFEK